jgi:hypothetical protein
MKRTIRGIEYDTETAELIRRFASGSWGDPAGYEESLYKTPGGKYFVYTNGGADSPYTAEKIACIAASKVEAWLEAHA